jgi:hypothetical protein
MFVLVGLVILVAVVATILVGIVRGRRGKAG